MNESEQQTGQMTSQPSGQKTATADTQPLMKTTAACLTRRAQDLAVRSDQLVTTAVIAGRQAQSGARQLAAGLPESGFEFAPPLLAGSATAKAGIPTNASAWMYLDTWYVTGFFRKPPREGDPEFPTTIGGDAREAVTIGDLGITAQQPTANKMKTDWVITSGKLLVRTHRPERSSVWYAYTEIYSPVDQELWCCFGVDDLGKAWVNGILRFASEGKPSPWVVNSAYRRVAFQKGYNTVLFQIQNVGGTTGFSMCLRIKDVK